MKQLTVYECEYCKKLFKTPNRHKCKYNPEMKSCFSCKHNKGFYEETIERYYSTHTEEYKTIFVDCELEMCDESVGDTPRNMQCNYYEYCGGKWFENEHGKEKEKLQSIKHYEEEPFKF